MIRISVKKRSTKHIDEVLEMPQQTTLSALRLFLRQTYAYFPTKYLFETTQRVIISKNTESHVLVGDVGEEIFINTKAYALEAEQTLHGNATFLQLL